MKATTGLSVLRGRMVECFWNGQRVGKVVSVRGCTLSVRFHEPHGKHRINGDQVVGVFYFGKLRTVQELVVKIGRPKA